MAKKGDLQWLKDTAKPGFVGSVIDVCAHCKKEYKSSEYSRLCDAIMQHKPACSYECNKALGQTT